MTGQQPNISLDQTTGVTCNECGNTFFKQDLVLRKASGLLTGSPQDSYIPIPVFGCTKCGHVNQEFLPRELRSLD